MMNQIISAILQVVLFTAIPFIVYCIKNKSAKKFIAHLGFSRPARTSVKYAVLLGLLYNLIFLTFINSSDSILEFLQSSSHISGKIKEMGLSLNSIVTLLVIAILSTTLAEEILFRGFIAKKLLVKLGYKTGNIFQAVIFGFVHIGLVSLNTTDVLFLIISFVFPFLLSYFIVVINEKHSNGSIVPGIIAHALSNIIGYTFIGYIL